MIQKQYSIIPYEKNHEQAVIDLVLGIQQGEFNIPITAAQQPDLADVKNFYQSRNGNFWVAINTENEVIGSIALIDVGEDFGTIRKMFVRADSRGKDLGVAQALLDVLEKWSIEKGMNYLYLGTLNFLEAAQRFYIRNGFYLIPQDELPKSFLKMTLDNRFYKKNL